jgi:beta-glucosidase/6-phospho-beta-glucosidase/beta-galactosidase
LRAASQVFDVSKRFDEIYIRENGCGVAHGPGADGIVHDSDRILFLRSFTQLSDLGRYSGVDGQVRAVGRHA